MVVAVRWVMWCWGVVGLSVGVVVSFWTASARARRVFRRFSRPSCRFGLLTPTRRADLYRSFGGTALHASVSDALRPEAARSVEADVAALDDPYEQRADLIDGSIGEASMCHTTSAYYAQGCAY